eukprot:scaffold2756_cov376-Prasinococcus_capsulatus_cf.AAC.7
MACASPSVLRRMGGPGGAVQEPSLAKGGAATAAVALAAAVAALRGARSRRCPSHGAAARAANHARDTPHADGN